MPRLCIYFPTCVHNAHLATSNILFSPPSLTLPFLPLFSFFALFRPHLPASSPSRRSLVEVSRGGCTYFVPDNEEGQEGEFDATIPVPIMLATIAPTGPPPQLRARSVQNMFLPPDYHQRYQGRTLLSMQCVPADDPRHNEIPPRYHSIMPLDDAAARRGTASSLGYPSALYKVVDSKDGVTYVLRRIDNTRATDGLAKATVAEWRQKHPHHPNVIGLRDAFVYHRALFFVHDYYPGAQSIADHFLDYKKPQGPNGGLVPESTMWTIICQILSALRSIHRTGLAARLVEPNRVLWTDDGRALISSVGLMDVLECESKKTITEMQEVRLPPWRIVCVDVGACALVVADGVPMNEGRTA